MIFNEYNVMEHPFIVHVSGKQGDFSAEASEFVLGGFGKLETNETHVTVGQHHASPQRDHDGSLFIRFRTLMHRGSRPRCIEACPAAGTG
jgi:hypothetical protein